VVGRRVTPNLNDAESVLGSVIPLLSLGSNLVSSLLF
jgi:hypothetical protein